MIPTADPRLHSYRLVSIMTAGWSARLKKNDIATRVKRCLACSTAHNATSVTTIARIVCQTILPSISIFSDGFSGAVSGA
jgi:hypothetical protein